MNEKFYVTSSALFGKNFYLIQNTLIGIYVSYIHAVKLFDVFFQMKKCIHKRILPITTMFHISWQTIWMCRKCVIRDKYCVQKIVVIMGIYFLCLHFSIEIIRIVVKLFLYNIQLFCPIIPVTVIKVVIRIKTM